MSRFMVPLYVMDWRMARALPELAAKEAA